jgi:hypothetical protein
VRQHGHLDELGVLEPVADDRRVLLGQRHDGQQLGLRAGLETGAIGPAVVEHLLDHLPLLVHLDGIDAEVLALVLMLFDRDLKGAVDVGQPLAKDVPEADQDRQADSAKLQLIHQFLQVDRLFGVLRDVHLHVPVGAHREVALTPALDLVQIGGIRHGPRVALTPGPGGSTRHSHSRA